MRRFILDENIIEFGLGESDQLVPLSPSKKLLDQIIQEGDSLVWSEEVLRLYLLRISRIQNRFPSPALRFLSVLFGSGAIRHPEDAISITDRDSSH